VPKRADIILLHGGFEHGRMGMNFITQCSDPHLQQAEAKGDEDARRETFRIELQICGGRGFALSQRKAWELGNPS